jgi:hypothetical protein
MLSRIKENHERLKNKFQNYLPLIAKYYGVFVDWFPGLMRGELTCLTGSASSSKTSWIKDIVIHQGIGWAKENNMDYKVLYFGLEESTVQFNYSLLSHQGYLKGMRYNIRDFECIGREVKAEDFGKLDFVWQDCEKMLEYVNYYADDYTSDSIYLKIRDFAKSRGKFFLNGKEITDLSKGWNKYVPDNSNEFIVVVVDHLLLLSKTKDEKDVHEAIWNMVENLRRYVVKHFNYSVVVLQHQDNVSENQTSRIREEVLPTLQGLGKNKEVGRSYMNVIGITNLNRTNSVGNQTGISDWKGYKMRDLGNYSRCLNIMKSRYGIVDVNTLVYFDGRVGHFRALPDPKGEDYKKILEHIKKLE